MVEFRVQLNSGGGQDRNVFVAFRPNGSVASTSAGMSYMTSDNNIGAIDGFAIVRTDTDGIVEWKCDNGAGSSYNVWLESYENF